MSTDRFPRAAISKSRTGRINSQLAKTGHLFTDPVDWTSIGSVQSIEHWVPFSKSMLEDAFPEVSTARGGIRYPQPSEAVRRLYEQTVQIDPRMTKVGGEDYGTSIRKAMKSLQEGVTFEFEVKNPEVRTLLTAGLIDHASVDLQHRAISVLGNEREEAHGDLATRCAASVKESTEALIRSTFIAGLGTT